MKAELNPKEKFQSFENEAAISNQKNKREIKHANVKKLPVHETIEHPLIVEESRLERLQSEVDVMKITIKNNREEIKVLH